MNFFARPVSIATLLAAGTLLLFLQRASFNRSVYVSSLAGGPVLAGSNSPELRAPGIERRNLVVTEHNEGSFHWLLQSVLACETPASARSHVDYDNAPKGRDVWSPSLYRWWLTAISRADQAIFGTSLNRSVDRAGLIADPLLLWIGIAGAVFAAWMGLGRVPAALIAVSGVSYFPFAAAFTAGVPDDRGLIALLVLAASLCLAIALRRTRLAAAPGLHEITSSVTRWFVAAGFFAGLLLWSRLATGVVFVSATLLGACFQRSLHRAGAWNGSSLPRQWRYWAIAGGLVALAGYFADYLPRGVGATRLDVLHPLYPIAWYGCAEILLVSGFRIGSTTGWRRRVHAALTILGLLPLVIIGWLRLRGVSAGPEKDLLWAKLANVPNGAVAPNFWAWIAQAGLSVSVAATVLPVTVLLLLFFQLLTRGAKAQAGGPTALLMVLAISLIATAALQIGAWVNADAVLIVLLGVAAAEVSVSSWIPAFASAVIAVTSGAIGLSLLWPRQSIGPQMILTSAEAAQLVERDLAHWLADRFEEKRPIVFAPPRETTALCYFADLRGIGTFAPENRAGFGTTLSIVGANTMEEVETLVRTRDIRCIVLPSWDPFLDDFARLYLSAQFSNRTSLLVRELRNWNLPLWLRPMAYQMPVIPGFENQRALVFEVVAPQTPLLAASRLAECLAELGDLTRAKTIADNLRRYPGDVGALAARINVQLALGDSTGAAETGASLRARLQTRADRFLAWDRRVSLAVALAQTGTLDAAKEQVEHCLKEADEAKLRALSTTGLFRLLVLAKTFEQNFPQAGLQDLAVRLLPPDARTQL